MWEGLFNVLGKALDLVSRLVGRRKAPAEQSPAVTGSENAAASQAAGKAGYDASKRAGPQ